MGSDVSACAVDRGAFAACAPTLEQLAGVVLPTCTDQDLRGIVGRFLAWLEHYDYDVQGPVQYVGRPSRVRRLPRTACAAYARQVSAIEDAARRHHGRSFAELDRSEQAAILENGLRPGRLVFTTDLRGEDVLVDLIAFYYRFDGAAALYGDDVRSRECGAQDGS
jgi:hypothetical protein